MPNPRRRRFSVQHDIAGRNIGRLRKTDQDSELRVTGNSKPNIDKKNVACANSSKINTCLEIVAENESSTSVMTVKEQTSIMVDKNVTASRSNIDFLSLMVEVEDPTSVSVRGTPNQKDAKKVREAKQANREGLSRRDKLPRQHRVKVRSPKRRGDTSDTNLDNNAQDNKFTRGTDAIDWNLAAESVDNVTCVESAVENTVEHIAEPRISNHSIEDMCRICHGGDVLSPELGCMISACMCRGTVGRVHVKCLERWLTESGKSRCEICGTRYQTRRVHRYGVPRALVMWLLSQNAKQLMVDSLGIMLMSPLAILAAWLSGRTLSGLMAQDTSVTPWPLASTFVLACMTLVCYYCWIVSAATRHALGWWIWYRSQYEVHLQLQNEDQ